MTGRLERLLQEERGQTLVLFVVLLSGFVVLLAFVVDVGAWLGTHRRLQSVADAAALAAVQSPGTAAGTVSPAIDDGWATLQYNPPLDPSAPLESVTVTATHDAPIILGGVASIPAFTEQATATAQAAPVSKLANSGASPALTQAAVPAGTTPPYIAPILINQSAFNAACTSGLCFGPPSRVLTFDAAGDGSGDFALANVCVNGPCPQPNGKTVRSWIKCSPCIDGTISVSSASGVGFAIIRNGPASRAGPAITQVENQPLIVPVFTGVTPYQIVGFAEFVVTSVDSWTSTSKVIEGYFTTYTLPASFSDNGGTGQTDFGVRAIGLTS